MQYWIKYNKSKCRSRVSRHCPESQGHQGRSISPTNLTRQHLPTAQRASMAQAKIILLFFGVGLLNRVLSREICSLAEERERWTQNLCLIIQSSFSLKRLCRVKLEPSSVEQKDGDWNNHINIYQILGQKLTFWHRAVQVSEWADATEWEIDAPTIAWSLTNNPEPICHRCQL